MSTKLVAVGVMVVGVSALGAGIWMVSVNDAPAPQPEPKPVIEQTPQRLAMKGPNSSELDGIDSDSGIDIPDQIQGRGQREQGGRDMFSRMEDMVKEYDLDGDGILSADERQKMREKMREGFLARMDLDGDGEVTFDERVISQRERMLESEWGQRRAERFDLDGDGVLSESELAALDASIAEREQQRIDRDLEQYDSDGDGVLSEEERAVQRVERDTRQEERMQRFTSQFDEDGDGDLNEDERVSAFSTMQDRRELGQFLNRYDTNKDREIGTTESEAFLSSYSNKEPYADVNRDGEVDAADIMAFRDYVERVQASAP